MAASLYAAGLKVRSPVAEAVEEAAVCSGVANMQKPLRKFPTA